MTRECYAVQGIVDREQKRILVVSLTHDEELMVKGDNMSVANDPLKEVFKEALKVIPEDAEDETSYNLEKTLTFSETKNFDFPNMSPKLRVRTAEQRRQQELRHMARKRTNLCGGLCGVL